MLYEVITVDTAQRLQQCLPLRRGVGVEKSALWLGRQRRQPQPLEQGADPASPGLGIGQQRREQRSP